MKEATKDFEAKKFTPPDGVKEERVATLTGGSAVYYRGYSMLREGTRTERQIEDRGVDFFEDDLNGGAGAVKTPNDQMKKPATEKSEEDNSDDGF